MAYITQDQKKVIAAKMKGFMPKDLKWSLSIDNHSTIICTIAAAPVDVNSLFHKPEVVGLRNGYVGLNVYYMQEHLKEGPVKEILMQIRDALNTDNYDNSDSMTDYFDVGHYIDIRFGKWDKPFKNTLDV